MQLRASRMKKQHILDEIMRTAVENGGQPLGRQRFLEATGIRESDWSGKYWARWNDAVQEAGLEPNQMQDAIPDEQLFVHYAGLIRELGHIPTSPEVRLKARSSPDFPSHNVFARLGSKQERIARTHAFCIQRADYQDVAEICEPHLTRQETGSEEEHEESQPEPGFVYLIKSGRYFKIGRTTSLVRRERELAIQLPEPAQTIHTIATDDPSGIESYWHRRFTDKRKNGEWFELTASDVKAFRRRKFM